MNAYENLTTRRSTRVFTDKKVEKELIEKIVYAGQCAPSGMNRQPLAYVVINDEETIKNISKLNAAVMGAANDPFYGAKTIIVVLANKELSKTTYLFDGALAMGNMLNAAHALGVNAIWIHRAKEVFASKEGLEYLKKWGLDERYEGIGNCAIGYGVANDTAKTITSTVVWA
ncbi:MAG: nitroreductase [Holdemanella sp.]|nr:nitroreductase [Holdemanella sp.]